MGIHIQVSKFWEDLASIIIRVSHSLEGGLLSVEGSIWLFGVMGLQKVGCLVSLRLPQL